jgi:hypothetical protein
VRRRSICLIVFVTNTEPFLFSLLCITPLHARQAYLKETSGDNDARTAQRPVHGREKDGVDSPTMTALVATAVGERLAHPASSTTGSQKAFRNAGPHAGMLRLVHALQVGTGWNGGGGLPGEV